MKKIDLTDKFVIGGLYIITEDLTTTSDSNIITLIPKGAIVSYIGGRIYQDLSEKMVCDGRWMASDVVERVTKFRLTKDLCAFGTTIIAGTELNHVINPTWVGRVQQSFRVVGQRKLTLINIRSVEAVCAKKSR